MSIIGVPNLKGIETWEGDLNIFVILCEENCEENWAIFRNKYLKNAKAILIREVVYM